MVASIKLLHLLEAFSTPWFLFSSSSNHHLVFFLLEIFNNIIQYQFDGNSNLVYTIIRKRQVFHALANLPTDELTINKCLSSRKIGERFQKTSATPEFLEKREEEDIASKYKPNSNESTSEDVEEPQKSDIIEASMEGSRPALPAEPGTLKATLLDTPGY